MLTKLIPVLLLLLLTACGNQASIISSKDNIVIIKAKPVIFLDALFLAEQECQKEELPAEYIENYSDDLTVVAFECVEEELVETATEENTETDEADNIDVAPENTDTTDDNSSEASENN